MNIQGFQKLTLLDYPGKVACTIFTGGCNFRCPFCHNAGLVRGEEETYDPDTILATLKKRQGLLDGVCITGGEPLLQPDIEDFIREVGKMGFAVKLDTNGSFPDRLRSLVDAGLVNYVAMDIKNRKERYAETVGKADFDVAPVEASVKYLLENHVDYEFRTTVVQEFHRVQDIEAIATWIQGAPKYFLQNFVDSGNLLCPDLHGVPKETMEEMQAKACKILPNTQLRGL